MAINRSEDQEILLSMARALFVNAWADKQIQLREEGRKHKNPGPGGDWMDIAPKTPPAATKAARALAKEFLVANRASSLTEVYERAIAAPGKRYGKRDSAEDFGFGVAMQALGSGVSWHDDNPEFGMKVPHIEFYL